MKTVKRKPVADYFLLFFVFFQAVSGLFGGFGLLSDPSGERLQMTEDFLAETPFSSYLIPGLILFILLGVFPLLVAAGLIRRWQWRLAERLNVYADKHWAWTFSLYLAIMLIVWIDVQIFLIGYSHFIQTFYALLGVVLLILTLVPSVMGYYSRVPAEGGQV